VQIRRNRHYRNCRIRHKSDDLIVRNTPAGFPAMAYVFGQEKRSRSEELLPNNCALITADAVQALFYFSDVRCFFKFHFRRKYQ